MAQYTVVGAGAIGATLGAYMIRGGENVLFVDVVPEHVEAINRKGLTVRSYQETFTVAARAVVVEDMPPKLGAVVLAVKAHSTGPALAQIAPKLDRKGFIVSAQNGLNELAIAQTVGADRTIGCFVNFSADYLEPGLIHFAGPGAFYLGELDGKLSERLQQIHRDFSHWPGGDIHLTDNIMGYLWGKMAYGAMLYATALTNETMAEAIDRNRDLMAALAREVLTVAHAESVLPLGFDGFEPDILYKGSETEMNASLDGIIDRRNRDEKKFSGIWRDLAVRKRKTEVDAHFEPILSLAKRYGCQCRLTARMVEMIHEIEAGKRTFGQENLDELRRLVP